MAIAEAVNAAVAAKALDGRRLGEHRVLHSREWRPRDCRVYGKMSFHHIAMWQMLNLFGNGQTSRRGQFKGVADGH